MTTRLGTYRFRVIDSGGGWCGQTVHSGGGGPTAVLLHGYLGSAEDWNAVASGLAEECRCIAVDLPAHGEGGVGRGRGHLRGEMGGGKRGTAFLFFRHPIFLFDFAYQTPACHSTPPSEPNSRRGLELPRQKKKKTVANRIRNLLSIVFAHV